MIGVCCRDSRRAVAREFFELFKTPWEFAEPGRRYDAVLGCGVEPPPDSGAVRLLYGADALPGDPARRTAPRPGPGGTLETPGGTLVLQGSWAALPAGAGTPLVFGRDGGAPAAVRCAHDGCRIVRVGYDLFGETERLLDAGQPPAAAECPALDLHIGLLRAVLLDAGLPVVEIPPCPPGHAGMACLTHDVDFVSLRHYGLDGTMAGFLARATGGALVRALRGRLPPRKMLRNWGAALATPLVLLGLRRDPWDCFEQYAALEAEWRSTFFLIPYKNRAGRGVTLPHAERRAARYGVNAIRETVRALAERGFEMGLHGIDAWHDGQAAVQERARIAAAGGPRAGRGVRMHWLCRGPDTVRVLEEAGFEYDATCGFNETVGYRAGTAQVFAPAGAARLLELPLHVQDTALFRRDALDLTDADAWRRCERVLDHVTAHGGVATFLWHMRSLAPERLWDGVYRRVLDAIRTRGLWCAPAGEIVDWFRGRRNVRFGRVHVEADAARVALRCAEGADPLPLRLRMTRPRAGAPFGAARAGAACETVWNGEPETVIPLKR
jgi:peptidoglycan/xylan/chitin deacetylase (PgdA/CDA1 family)